MGMDIAFNREAAIKAGLKLVIERNGTDAQVAEELAKEDPDQGYIKWLTELQECVCVPGTNFVVDNGGVDSIVVRANTWGRVYGPLTQWLKANNIPWSEF